MSKHSTPAGPPTPIRVVLVDDHRMFRTGVRAELTEAMSAGGPVCEFVGEAPDVDAAVAVIRREAPDVVLLDVHLPGGSGHGGADVVRGCAGVETADGKPVRFLALSVSDAAEDVIAVIRAGARGYVDEDDHRARPRHGHPAGRRRRRGLLAAARRLRPRRVRGDGRRDRRGRRGARPAVGA